MYFRQKILLKLEQNGKNSDVLALCRAMENNLEDMKTVIEYIFKIVLHIMEIMKDYTTYSV